MRTSIGFGPGAPQEWAKHVNIPVADKKLHWIRGTSARWDGYLEFQRRPEPALEWFETHMA